MIEGLLRYPNVATDLADRLAAGQKDPCFP